MTGSFYGVLGVGPDADEQRIRQAYRERVKRHHPDVSSDPKARVRFKCLTTARETLTDESKRARYDRLGHETYVEKHLDSSVWDRADGFDADSEAVGVAEDAPTDDGSVTVDQDVANGAARDDAPDQNGADPTDPADGARGPKTDADDGFTAGTVDSDGGTVGRGERDPTADAERSDGSGDEHGNESPTAAGGNATGGAETSATGEAETGATREAGTNATREAGTNATREAGTNATGGAETSASREPRASATGEAGTNATREAGASARAESGTNTSTRTSVRDRPGGASQRGTNATERSGASAGGPYATTSFWNAHDPGSSRRAPQQRDPFAERAWRSLQAVGPWLLVHAVFLTLAVGTCWYAVTTLLSDPASSLPLVFLLIGEACFAVFLSGLHVFSRILR